MFHQRFLIFFSCLEYASFILGFQSKGEREYAERGGLTALWKICCLALFLEKTLLTTRPASFFSATAIAASTASRDVVSVEVDALVDAAVEDG